MNVRVLRTLLFTSSALASLFVGDAMAAAQPASQAASGGGPVAAGTDTTSGTDLTSGTDPSSGTGEASNPSPEIIVTATRQREFLSRVPASVSAFTQKSIETQGIKDISDISRFAPDLQFSRGALGASPAGSSISIRGIASSTGTSTTGIYIDDTPIQVRRNGYTSRNAFPTLFDLERVEILRGPQGTLFGSGSEGGAVRFITPAPSLTTYSTYERAEISTTQYGAPSGEIGAALGGPIVTDRLGFRVSAYVRRDGGYIDHVDYFTKQVTDKNSNYQDSIALRAAITWTPTDWLELTPSVLYNKQHFNDLSNYWLQSSDKSKGRFVNENAAETPDRQHFTLSAFRAEASLGAARLISNTSYFKRKEAADSDFTELDVQTGGFPTGVDYPQEPGVPDISFQRDRQANFTQEVRVQKADPEGWLNYTFGGFYSSQKQDDNQRELTGQLEDLFVKYYGLNFEQLFGAPSYEGIYSYVDEVSTREKQYAVFGQVDVKPTSKLKLTAGLRYTHDTVHYREFVAGPYAFPEGVTLGSFKTSPLTPKFGISYQANPDNLFYASAAKGFRPGGGQVQAPAFACRSDLAALGLTQSPTSYDSDSVWSYEAGAKNKLFNGRLRLDASIYYIKWSNIQQTVPLRSCGISFTANLGSATSKGVDFTLAMNVTDNISLGVTLGYTDARFDDDVRSGTALVVGKHDRVVPIPFAGSAFGQYDFVVFGKKAFARADYQFDGGGTSADKLAQGYNPLLPNLPVTNLVNLRVGVHSGPLLISAFMNNVANSAPETLGAYTKRTSLIYGSTVRPRTTGLTVSYSY